MKFLFIGVVFLTLVSISVFAGATDKTVVCSGKFAGTFTLIDKMAEYDGMNFWEFTSDQLVLDIHIETDLSEYKGPDYIRDTSGMPQIKTMDVYLSNVEGNNMIIASASSHVINHKLQVSVTYRAKKDGTTIHQYCKEI